MRSLSSRISRQVRAFLGWLLRALGDMDTEHFLAFLAALTIILCVITEKDYYATQSAVFITGALVLSGIKSMQLPKNEESREPYSFSADGYPTPTFTTTNGTLPRADEFEEMTDVWPWDEEMTDVWPWDDDDECECTTESMSNCSCERHGCNSRIAQFSANSGE